MAEYSVRLLFRSPAKAQVMPGSNDLGLTRSTTSVTRRMVSVPFLRSVPRVCERMATTSILPSCDW